MMANMGEPHLSFDFKRPKVLDYCSITERRMNFESIENLKYLHEPSWRNISTSKPLDLDIGFENYQVRVLCEKLDGMLEWFQKYPAKLQEKLKVKNIVFITYRGTLQTLMKMNYENRTGFVMYATKFKNLIFLSEDKVRNNRADDRSAYWGLKCEQLLFSRNPNEIPDSSGLIDSQEEFCSILYNRLNGRDIVYGGDIDGIKTEHIPDGTEKDEILKILNDPSKAELIELKTSYQQFMNRPRAETLLMWYIQCMLSGVEKIFVAGKNKQGKVSSTNILRTRSLPLRQSLWNSQDLTECLDEQLAYIEMLLKKKSNFTTFKLMWNPSLEFPMYTEISRDRDTYQILSDDFIDFLRLQTNSGKGESIIKSPEKIGEQKKSKKKSKSKKEKTPVKESRKSPAKKDAKNQSVSSVSAKEKTPLQESRKSAVEKDVITPLISNVSTKEKTPMQESIESPVKKDAKTPPISNVSTKEKTPVPESRKSPVKKDVKNHSTKEKTPVQESKKSPVKNDVKNHSTKEKTPVNESGKLPVRNDVKNHSTKEKTPVKEARKPLVKTDLNAPGQRKQHFSPRYIYNSSLPSSQYVPYNFYPFQNSSPGNNGHYKNPNNIPVSPPQQYYRDGSVAYYGNHGTFYNFNQNQMHRGQMIPPLLFGYGYNAEQDSKNQVRFYQGHQGQHRFNKNKQPR